MKLSGKELAALRRNPNRTVQALAKAYDAAREKADSLAAELRECQERLAECQLANDSRLLVVLHRDGFVEAWANDWQPVVVACLPDLGPEREEEAEGYMLSRVPLPYREIYQKTGRRIVAGNCSGCMDKNAYRLLQIELDCVKFLKSELQGA